MSLQRLKITNFRNISSHNDDFAPYFNIIAGENGSGKTSLLEAIYFIGHAKSFRTHMANQLVQHDLDEFTLFAEILNDNEQIRIGVKKSLKQTTQIKLDGQGCQSSAELAARLPMQVLNPDSYKVLEAGPKYRRQFLDWGLFYVEQRFFMVWKRFQRALTQRNSALKVGRLTAEISAWDVELAQHALQLDEFRQDYFDKLLDVLKPLLEGHAVLNRVECEYYRGWTRQQDYSTVLSNNLSRDRQMGYTTRGPQRADIKFTLDGYPAQEVLSRGQQKILVSFLCLAQGMLCQSLCQKSCLYLVDDLPSELDHYHKGFLLKQLAVLGSQVFITGVDAVELQSLVAEFPHKMFHVEQGRIKCSPATSMV